MKVSPYPSSLPVITKAALNLQLSSKLWTISDEHGYVYVLKLDVTHAFPERANDYICIKVGNTKDALTRYRSWKASCSAMENSEIHKFFPGYHLSTVPRKRLERLVLCELEGTIGVEKFQGECPKCRVKHQELFFIKSNIAWESMIETMVARWIKYLGNNPKSPS